MLPPSCWVSHKKGTNIDTPWELSLFGYQQEVVEYCADLYNTNKKSCMIVSWTATGKCFWKDTGIIMFDWSIKMVQDIKIWDQLMWPDSLPRNVLSTTSWYDDLYEVNTIRNESFVCNKDHILVLQASYKRRWFNKWDIIYKSVEEYLTFTTAVKHQWKIIKSSGIDFETKDVLIDPYYLWYWLGNGSKCSSDLEINIHHKKIISYFKNFSEQIWLYYNITTYWDKGSLRFSISKNDLSENKLPKKTCTTLRASLKALWVLDNKHIPNIYLYNSKEIRYQLLAWLLDSDGYLDRDFTTIVFNNTNKRIIDSIVYLCKSLWLWIKIKKRLTHSQCRDDCVSRNVSISWATYLIPTKHKIANQRILNKNILRSGFTIKNIDKWNYYWFTLNWDHLFLLDNFIVSHNSHMIMGIIYAIHHRTVIVVPNTLIGKWLQDKLWVMLDARFMTAAQFRKIAFTDIPDVLIVTGASFNNIFNQINDIYDTIICDEGHHLSAKRKDQLNFRKGDFICMLTATPERKEYGQEWFEMYLGNIHDTERQALPVKVMTYEYDHDYTVDEVLKAQDGLSPESPELYRRLYCYNPDRIEHLKKILSHLIDSLWFKKIIIFTDRTAHIDLIQSIIPNTIRLTGAEDKTKFLEEIANKDEYLIVAMSQCAGEWFDLPELECWILFMSTSWNNTIDQTAGRIRRFSWDKQVAYYIDFIDILRIMWWKKKKLWRYERSRIYKNKGREVTPFENLLSF